PSKTAVVGPGVALDLPRMLEEIDTLGQRGIRVGDNLRISDRAHLVMPYHKKQDALSEAAVGQGKIGTTARGIGPCYADKMQRATALRVVHLLPPDAFRQRLTRIVERKNKFFAALYDDREPINAATLADEYLAHAGRIRPNICDSTQFLYEAVHSGKRLLFE